MCIYYLLKIEHWRWLAVRKLPRAYNRKELEMSFLLKFDPHIGKNIVHYITNKRRKDNTWLRELECVQTFARDMEELMLNIDYTCRSLTQNRH